MQGITILPSVNSVMHASPGVVVWICCVCGILLAFSLDGAICMKNIFSASRRKDLHLRRPSNKCNEADSVARDAFRCAQQLPYYEWCYPSWNIVSSVASIRQSISMAIGFELNIAGVVAARSANQCVSKFMAHKRPWREVLYSTRSTVAELNKCMARVRRSIYGHVSSSFVLQTSDFWHWDARNDGCIMLIPG